MRVESEAAWVLAVMLLGGGGGVGGDGAVGGDGGL